MTFTEIYQSRPAISFEVSPPKTADGVASLQKTMDELVTLKPALVTVTYGAMGSTQQTTQLLVTGFKKKYQIPVASHLTCISATRQSIRQYAETLLAHGVRHVVALRGDIPPDAAAQGRDVLGDFKHASELVAFIKQHYPQISMAVAGYPEKHLEAPDMRSDIQYLKQKVDAGADAVITQLFYDNQNYSRFCLECAAAGIRVPIIPGLMPVVNLHQIKRITSMCGATIPKDLMQQLDACGDDPMAVLECGVAWTVRQARELLAQKVPGIHFYVLNKAQAAEKIVKQLS